MSNFNLKTLLGASVALPYYAAGLSAVAQEEVVDAPQVQDVVVVTARFREESVDDIGQIINLYTSEDLVDAGIVRFEDIVRETPGLDNLSRGPGLNLPSIRGISSSNTNADLIGQPATVTQFFDEVSITTLNNGQTDLPLYDLNRVEVLKGPQPTYFGEGALGGSLRFHSQDPDMREFTGRTRAEISFTENGGENYILDGSISIPLIEDKLAVRLTGFFEEDGGFIDAPNAGIEDANDYDRSGITAVMLFEPTDNFSWRLSGFYQETNVGFAQTVTGNIDDLSTALPGPDERTDQSFLVSNKFSLDLGQVTLESVTGYFDRENERNYFDAVQTFVANNVPGFIVPGATVFSTNAQVEDTFSQDLRIITDFDSPLNFVGGLYYAETDSIVNQVSVSPQYVAVTGSEDFAFAPFAASGTQYSGFGEFQLSLMEDRLRLAAGARYFEQEFKVSFDEGFQVYADASLLGVPGPLRLDASFLPQLVGEFPVTISEWLPRAQVEFDLNENVLAFATIAKGARNGFNNSPIPIIGGGLSLDEFLFYDGDAVVSVEAGFKGSFLDESLSVELAGFVNTWDDFQATIVVNGGGFTDNVGQAETIGVEGSLWWQANDNLSLFASGTLLSAELKQELALSSGLQSIIAPEGTPLPQTPEESFVFGGEYRRPISGFYGTEAFARVSYSYTGERLNALSATPGALDNFLPSAEIVSLRGGIDGDDWSLALYADNLTNEIVPTFDSSATTGEIFINRPRSIGAVLRKQF